MRRLVVLTLALGLAMAGLCAGGHLISDGIAYVADPTAITVIVFCPVWGALYGFIPALATGYGLSHPDRATGKGRLRTLALGTAGGLLSGFAMVAMGGRSRTRLRYWVGHGRRALDRVRRTLHPGFPLSVPGSARSA